MVTNQNDSIEMTDPIQRNEKDDEKKTHGPFENHSSAIQTRTINRLPLTPTNDYTPYFGLEFDLRVQDYCRNRNNYNLHKNDINSASKQQQQPQQKNGFVKQQKLSAAHAHEIASKTSIKSCKVVVSGDVAVGKTCLVNRFGHDVYSSNYQTTIGVDFDLQRFDILGQAFQLQIWDTAGLERFRCITNSYYRGCQAALLVFDMSNMSTLANVLKWKEEVLSSSKTFEQLSNESHHLDSNPTSLMSINTRSNESPLLFLVGTKCDLPLTEPAKQFIREQANKVADILQAELWFVSAQTGENVTEMFNRVAALTFNRCVLNEIQKLKFETSTLGACLKEKIIQQQKEFWLQSSKLIKITKRKDGDDRRSRCVNIQCVIK